ncbi:hypothetical protein JRO89_XSUnG0191600 [Xanthoceras sorbifolium]|uniref:Large ribosomal subunit protein bL25 beta domain-containing protein n=1 Tax=Xanthoceras sorbifolium TaxID=99658 RepID=A0ABQ8GXS3_9ROSI|nr:hypothetical protein JRO89_XSUnG0191600 [Xanthoceras sorbifolium]
MSRWCRNLKTVVQNPNSPFSQASSSYHTIQAIPRECTGSRIAARDRAQGRIPAVVFSQNLLDKNPENRSPSRKQLLTTERKQIQAILKSVELPFFYSTTFPLQIRAGSGSSVLLDSGKVLPVKVHSNEATGSVYNLVFVWADDGTELKVDVPVVFKGEDNCPGLKKGKIVYSPDSVLLGLLYSKGLGKRKQKPLIVLASSLGPGRPIYIVNAQYQANAYCYYAKTGGYLNRIRTTLKYLCPAEHIPPKIEVDVSNLDIGDRVLMHDVEVHPSLKLLSKNENMPICKITATNSENPEPAAM